MTLEFDRDGDEAGEPQITYTGEAEPPEGDLALWYRRPADSWEEQALPVGNGRLGGMVFGSVNHGRIQLNVDTLWSGEPTQRNKEGAAEYLDQARQLLFDGKYVQAEELVQQKMMGLRIDQGVHTYQTLGNLMLLFELKSQAHNYRRSLDLETGIARVEYEIDGKQFTREVFSSAADDVMVVRVDCDEPGAVKFDLEMGRPEKAETIANASDALTMTGGFPVGKGVDFEARARVIREGGNVESVANTLFIDSVDAATIIVAAATNYHGDDPREKVEQTIRAAAKRRYSQLRADHIRNHHELFGRVHIDLGRSEFAQLPTNERLERLNQGADDPGLVEQYFQFGRYLLIGCSRPQTMPANLQGLWAEGVKPPWNSDYHININMQMNYWPAEICNLSECHQPFFEFTDNLRPQGRVTAEETYGCGGFVAHHTSDPWQFTAPIGKAVYGMWPTGGAWCLRRFWEHYLYTGDREFLQNEAYPAMKEAIQFFFEYLAEDPDTGRLVSGPSTSPENSFRTENGEVAHLTMGPTMDRQIIRELFDNFLKASAELDIDDEFTRRADEYRDRLADTQIGTDGRIMEWPKQFDEPEPGHRHISHLFGLYPAHQITIDDTPKLAEAARKSLEYRLSHGGGHTGWSRAWTVNCYARLQDSAEAYRHLHALLADSTTQNLLDTHPPFQIDGNFGGCASIAHMLLQSYDGIIKLLPALPDNWDHGEVSGLRARGGFEVDIQWDEAVLTAATITSELGKTCQVETGIPFEVFCDAEAVLETETPDTAAKFDTNAGKVYELTPTHQ